MFIPMNLAILFSWLDRVLILVIADGVCKAENSTDAEPFSCILQESATELKKRNLFVWLTEKC